ncbi:membrane protein insertase YidC [Kaustia mangrovi]|uniref:Membrane protein insertase YidC n=1 Tax=Kaustia mangrovi TaxID=2593653 RepID=A0A7S8C582_9HYPH|nr:membrane protein insertase YidC [Kaustia mangrovi]QPC43593.1 membrane protein insertase YidC [Kaustia mangrovi]
MGADNKQFILAIVLSAVVILLWQVFVGIPQLEQEPAPQQTATDQASPGAGTAPSPGGTTAPTAPGGTAASGSPAAATAGRAQALAASPRIAIETPRVDGSINLKGARLDDLHLRDYHVTVDPESPTITLLSPSGGPGAYYTEHGWAAGGGAQLKLPTKDTVWSAPEGATLTPSTPVTLTWDNGEGLVFKRTVSVDDHYLFTVRQDVENTSGEPVTLFPYALVSRRGTPPTEGFFILHEGPIGYLGDDGLIELDYSDLQEAEQPQSHKATGGWLGITDKYWAVTIIPDQSSAIEGRFLDMPRGGVDTYQADYLVSGGIAVPAGGTATYESRVFAGAKVVQTVDGYAEEFGIKQFDLLIDWGWFYFITKPMFWLLEFFNDLIGNFGVAILMATVVVKLIFFPLANKSYISMSKMKKLQPELVKLRERYPDDRMKQQEAMMALYKKEKVTPVSGCLPILIQIPVFFALYKVLFVSIEMRHAPFFGWIQDLSAPDPTTIFNLFGLIPWTPPELLMLGVWPIIMGVTMWVQMRLNPAPPDPIQAKIFNWMPVFFTFLLARFPSGLVIYWAWNNTLSVLQQYVIMRRQGVKVELFQNIRSSLGLGRKKGVSESEG